MNTKSRMMVACGAALLMTLGLAVIAQSDRPERQRGGGPPQDQFRGPGGGPPFMNQDLEVLHKFDKNNDDILDADERKAAREFIREERSNRPTPRFGRRNDNLEPPEPGQKVSPADVKKFEEEPFYSTDVVRTLFLEFENADWEKELSDFHNTDVEVPAMLTVDGKTYKDVGVHFRGMSSYMGVPEGRKRSLNLSVDLVHKDQNVGGYRTLNLLNAHEDPTYLRPVLFYDIAREYIPAPKANFVRVVINGEDWGIYNNVQQFNKDFVQEWFGTTKGARWKVRGSPGGRGSLAYLGSDPEEYKKIYTIKSKDDAKSWKALVELCRVLNETKPENLVKELSPILDIDGALKFLALDNVLINNDGYWIRTSDYSIYQDTAGKFHIIPQDANETFAKPGGPGGPGGGMRFMPPAIMLTRSFLDDGDQDKDNQLSRAELESLSKQWFSKLDTAGSGRIDCEKFATEMQKVFPGPMRFPPGAPNENPDNPPPVFKTLFEASDRNKDGTLVQNELQQTFTRWLAEWDENKSNKLEEGELRTGLFALLPAPAFRGPNPFAGPPGGPRPNGPGPEIRMMPGPGRNMPPVEGVKLDPLVAAKDESKPLISKLLAVPELREKYLSYVRDIAGKHLDWKTLGPRAQKYHALLDPYAKVETRGLDSYEAFQKALTEDLTGGAPFGRLPISIKNFADQRREYLVNYKPPQ